MSALVVLHLQLLLAAPLFSLLAFCMTPKVGQGTAAKKKKKKMPRERKEDRKDHKSLLKMNRSPSPESRTATTPSPANGKPLKEKGKKLKKTKKSKQKPSSVQAKGARQSKSKSTSKDSSDEETQLKFDFPVYEPTAEESTNLSDMDMSHPFSPDVQKTFKSGPPTIPSEGSVSASSSKEVLPAVQVKDSLVKNNQSPKSMYVDVQARDPKPAEVRKNVSQYL